MLRLSDRESIIRRRKLNKSKPSLELNGVVGDSSRGILFNRVISRSRSHSEEHQAGSSDSVSSDGLSHQYPNHSTVFAFLVVAIGTIASMLFLGFGVSGAVRETQIQFDLRAEELVHEMQAAFADYETASMWLHESCRSRQITRVGFRDVYEYLIHGGLEVDVCVGQEFLDHFLKVPSAHCIVFLVHWL